jgi:hypothetical protein
MTYLRLIGLAAIAAMALTASIASSASAATICSTAGKGIACKSGHGNQYTGSISATNVVNFVLTITNSEGHVINVMTATSSTLEGTITNSEEGTGEITKLTVTGLSSSLCSSLTATTTASPTNPWPTTMATDGATENTNGIMTISNLGLSFTCTFLGLPVTCVYSASSGEATLDGSDTEPKITASNVRLTYLSGNKSVCGEGVDWTSTHRLKTPSSVFVE